MFLHTNLSPKWSLEIPADFGYYNRRWQVSLTQAVHCFRNMTGLEKVWDLTVVV